jgi:transposase-like protein
LFARVGISALGLQRVLGFGSYETAWTWLHKLRRAMVRPGRDRLSGSVEVDETYVGGPEEGTRGRQTETKAIVVVAAEKDGNGIGRIRIRRVMDVSGDSLISFVKEAVTSGSEVHTDGWSGYSGLVKAGYQHQVTVISHSKELAHELMPRVHIVASLLKRWLAGTHQGGVQNHQLDYYLDEFTFRFNRRHSKARGLLFHRLVQQAVAVGPAPYRTLIGAESRGHRLLGAIVTALCVLTPIECSSLLDQHALLHAASRMRIARRPGGRHPQLRRGARRGHRQDLR